LYFYSLIKLIKAKISKQTQIDSLYCAHFHNIISNVIISHNRDIKIIYIQDGLSNYIKDDFVNINLYFKMIIKKILLSFFGYKYTPYKGHKNGYNQFYSDKLICFDGDGIFFPNGKVIPINNCFRKDQNLKKLVIFFDQPINEIARDTKEYYNKVKIEMLNLANSGCDLIIKPHVRSNKKKLKLTFLNFNYEWLKSQESGEEIIIKKNPSVIISFNSTVLLNAKIINKKINAISVSKGMPFSAKYANLFRQRNIHII